MYALGLFYQRILLKRHVNTFPAEAVSTWKFPLLELYFRGYRFLCGRIYVECQGAFGVLQCPFVLPRYILCALKDEPLTTVKGQILLHFFKAVTT